MKALLDEQLSPLVARALHERGLDVEAVAERTDLPQASDAQVMDAAATEGRAVVTNNVKDFRPIAAERMTDGRGHAGLVLLPARRDRSRNATGVIASAIEALMRKHPDGMANAEHWIPPF